MSLYIKSWYPFPYEIKQLDPELNSQITEKYSGNKQNFVQVGSQNWLLSSGYAEEADIFYNFDFRSDDVIVITYPRSGTTLTQEMVWLICNNLDYKNAAEQFLVERFPFLEYSTVLQDQTATKGIPEWKKLADAKGQRFIKTHLPFDLLPQNLTKIGCKIIYVARNPKDVAVSCYHLQRSFKKYRYKGDIRTYWDLFERNLLPWSPYWEHVKEGWIRRNEKNLLFMFYEDVIKDVRSAIQKVSTFFDKSFTIEELETLENHLKIDNFRKNISVNFEHADAIVKNEESFIRKGKIGGWKDYFDEDLEQRANIWIEKNLTDTDLTFPM